MSSVVGPKSSVRVNHLLKAAEDVNQCINDPYTQAVAHLGRGWCAFVTGRFGTGVKFLSSAESLLADTCTGVTWEAGATRYMRIFCNYFMGDFAEIVTSTSRLIRECEARGDLLTEFSLTSFAVPIMRCIADEPEAAADELRTTATKMPTHEFPIQKTYWLMAKGIVNNYRDSAVGWGQLRDEESHFQRTGIREVQGFRTTYLLLRAQAALISARLGVDPESRLRSAERDARRLSGEEGAWGQPFGVLMKACVQASRKPDSGPQLFAEAVKQLEAADLGAFAAAARYRLGERTSGEEGQRLRNGAIEWLKNQRVVNPLRIIKSFAPIGRSEDHPDSTASPTGSTRR